MNVGEYTTDRRLKAGRAVMAAEVTTGEAAMHASPAAAAGRAETP